ncbi:MAG: DUF2934 domain-containing protein [Nitrospiraceae bacterium]|nr:DUF2934 domain-containing protein [Nitrospiraceae bacterium]
MKTENLTDEIARVAYDLYLKSGCQPCRELGNWLEAEMIVLARHAGQDMEEPEEPAPGEEAEELQGAQSEGYLAGRGMEGREGETVMEEIDAQEAVAARKSRKKAVVADKAKPAKKRIPASKASLKKGR